MKPKFHSNDSVSVAVVPQRRTSFFALPWHVKLEIYQKLDAGDLINFHLAFPNSTSELAPFYNLKSSFQYKDYALWPSIHLNRVPSPIEEKLIHAAYDLNLKLNVGTEKTFNAISDELRCKVTEWYIYGKSISGRLHFNPRFDLIITFNRK